MRLVTVSTVCLCLAGGCSSLTPLLEVTGRALPVASAPAPVDPDKQRWAANEGLERQHDHTLRAVDNLVRKYRPACPEPAEHHAAMLALDEVFHYTNINITDSAAVQDFLRRRLEVAALEMESTTASRDAIIWKLYDHAFVVRTATATVAFDLTRGPWLDKPGFPELATRIARQCDALFISHIHGDHRDEFVIRAFQAQGKPVVGPGSLARDGKTVHRVALAHERELGVVVLPGYQKELENDVYLVTTPEGLCFAHTGDLAQGVQTPGRMWDWIDHVKDNQRIDVLFVNCWTPQLQRTVRGFGPRMVITGHENELWHNIEERKGYYLSYDRLRRLEVPSIVMTWGESCRFPVVHER
jgi:hypothetical protein